MARRTILFCVAFVIAALGTTMVVLYVQGIDARATEGQALVEVLTATDVVKAGESVSDAESAGKFEKTRVVRDDVVEGALSSTTSIADEVALGTIYPGQQIIGQQFGSAQTVDTLTIPDDKLAVSVELTDPARVAGFVYPGSSVAIFASADPELYKADGTTQKLSPVTRLLLAQVEVIGVGDTSVSPTTTTSKGSKTTEQIPRTILTIAVTQAQAEKVIYAARNGDLSFALRTAKSKVVDGPGVTARDIMPEVFGGVR
ncbi:pilus assembly protein CpaB [Nocardioides ginsengisegetis]|uniref:Pilus assembly protein CpaB n=1 Tax=Nocardioides ginsengisegetis TaxID=661491 RepID=A0A7W3IYZ5_9ACTN|nr:Flp pilus assembly protein CpaB [Nocardioides ginsengisegetis]MBA8803191.1 pilus assembly protein CpaB [Nocardioides ginsengisegetis]